MCFALELDEQWLHSSTDPLSPFVTVAYLQEYNDEQKYPAQSPSVNLTGVLKRFLSMAPLDGEPSPKRARLSIKGMPYSEIIPISDDSPPHTPQRTRSTSISREHNHRQHDGPKRQTSGGDADESKPETEVKAIREKANRMLREKKQIIMHLRAEKAAVEQERDDWQNRVVASEAEQRLLRENMKRYQEDIRVSIRENIQKAFNKKLKAAEADHEKSLKTANARHNEGLESKARGYQQSLKAHESKHQEQMSQKAEKLGKAELALRETKSAFKSRLLDLKTQHRAELKRLKPELSDTVKDQKAELKAREAAVEKMTKEKEAAESEAAFFQKQWATVQERNDALQAMVRDNSKKVIYLQQAVNVWKRNATQYQKARDEMQKEYEAKIVSRDEQWLQRYNIQYTKAQDNEFQRVEARRGVLMLNNANDRNIGIASGLRCELTEAKKKLEAANVEIRMLRNPDAVEQGKAEAMEGNPAKSGQMKYDDGDSMEGVIGGSEPV